MDNVEVINTNIIYPKGFKNNIPEDFDKEWIGKVPFDGDKMFETIRKSKTIYDIMGTKKVEEDDSVFVIIQDGGVGDAICASSMIESAKRFYPEKILVVGSSHPEVLELNPYIDHLYHLGSPGDLFEKWVKPLNWFGSVIKRDIYNACAHKLFPGPLAMIWCYLYGVPYLGDDHVKIFLSEKEEKDAIDFLKTFPRPVVIVHGTGAKLTFDPKVQITPNKDYFYDYWAEIVKELAKDYDVVQIGGPNEEQIPGVTTYMMGTISIRQTAALIKHSLTHVCIDSICNHLSAGVGNKGVVLFGRSNPYIAGHRSNVNVWVDGSCEFNDFGCGRPQGYFGDSEMFRGIRRPWVCPTRSCMRALTPPIVYNEVKKVINEKLQK